MSYLTEAFKQLNIIDEDLFPTDSEGLNKLKDFMKSDIDDEDLVVYDETANNEDEIKDSYNGKVILRCNVCKSYFFKEPKSVIIDAEVGLANVGDECCYCHNDMGYNVVGVVAPYAADVSKEERAEDAHEEPTEVDVAVDDIDDKPEDVNESVKRVNEETNYDKVMRVLDNMKKEEPAQESLNDINDKDLNESVKKVNEDLKDVSITTDDTKIQMTSEENGKVTVTTEPIKDKLNTEDAEVVKPLSAADKDVIADNDGEDGEEVLDDTAIDFDEINDEDLDKLGEKYFTKVYDNVKSFKSTACKLDESGVILEGKITFKSGKEAKTAFNFNEAYITKKGKVKLIGENAQFAKNKKAFTLTGSLNDKKLVVESFTYNYRTKDEKTGKSTRLYGTVSK